MKKKEKNKNNNPQARKKMVNLMMTVSLFIVLAFLLFQYFNHYFLGGRIRSSIRNKKPIAILLLGKDDSDRVPKTDSILIGLFDPGSKRFGVIAAPRDLKTKISTKVGYQTLKINNVYSRYGPRELMKILRQLTGIDIKYYLAFDIAALVKTIDLVGGVEVYTDIPMKYIDHAGNLFIDIPAGITKCDGLKAMEFLRFRNDERGDIGRLDRQYEFMLDFMKTAVHKNNILLNIKLLKVLFNYLETNLNFNDVISLIKYSSSADFNNIEVIKIPGRFVNLYGIDYIETNPNQTKKLVGDFLYRISLYKPDFAPEEIKVQVLNGSGKSGVAKLVRDKLVRLGFNVVEFGNAPVQNHDSSIILNVSGNMKKAMRVSSSLHAGNVYTKINNFVLIDVTVIVGKDYDKLL
ncbi:MAG: LCP family protein [bacterium]|nr:LCP family protein [bacterium]